MQVSASAYFDNQTYPAILLFQAGCSVGEFLACDVGTWSVAAIDPMELVPGTYYLVVDSGLVSGGIPSASNYVLTVTTYPVADP